ncbi:MAG TPA: transposase [Fimbriimonas sp.]|nr:transposase [Fimbriimonas sp.]
MEDYAPALEDIKKRQGDLLPHWTAERGIYHVTFRLADSLPSTVLQSFMTERDDLLRQKNLSKDDYDRLQYLASERIEEYLDSGAGECFMKQPPIAEIVSSAVQHFDGDRYRLHAWCVMPNHVHLVLEPLGKEELSKTIHSIKSFTANKVNQALCRKGAVWQPEYYDHLIRNEAAYHRVVDYVLKNPSKANLREWQWVGSLRTTD